ncbi:MAG TPA: TetR/AcrR family transcriptional regulator [Acidimicrobiales bacterium]|nr:TetR/AcrR family transcriptional regulator [Acidimicrobiales bacterium]
MATVEQADGRRARRERNRTAVIDAMFELLAEGRMPPNVEEVAERAEVSVSSVFRYFDGLDDLHGETVRRYFERFAPLFEVPAAADSRAGRIAALVDARLELYETIAPIGRIARIKAGEPTIADTLVETRRRFARQVREHLAADLAPRGRPGAQDAADLVDALTSFESWDLLRSTHGRSRAAVRRAWIAGIERVLA